MKPNLITALLLIGLAAVSCGSGDGVVAVERETIRGIEMVSIPGGSFQMGHDYDPAKAPADVYSPDEQPVHTVTLSPFQIGTTEITQQQYESVMGENPSTRKGADLPVTHVSANTAVLFCNRLSEAAGLESCYDETTTICDFSKNGFRLPTEAEWEYACRAGSSSLYNTGDTVAALDTAGWYLSNSDGGTHPVGEKTPNAWGLYDMHGNVWEWCYDGYDQHYHWGNYPDEAVNDPLGYDNFNLRIMRGGSWYSEASECRSATRGCFWTGGDHFYTGFRVARSLR